MPEGGARNSCCRSLLELKLADLNLRGGELRLEKLDLLAVLVPGLEKL